MLPLNEGIWISCCCWRGWFGWNEWAIKTRGSQRFFFPKKEKSLQNSFSKLLFAKRGEKWILESRENRASCLQLRTYTQTFWHSGEIPNVCRRLLSEKNGKLVVDTWKVRTTFHYSLSSSSFSLFFFPSISFFLCVWVCLTCPLSLYLDCLFTIFNTLDRILEVRISRRLFGSTAKFMGKSLCEKSEQAFRVIGW